MTKHKSLIRQYHDTMCRTLILCTACLTVHSCSDDPFNKYDSPRYDSLDFKVSAPDMWTEGGSRAGKSPDDVIIRKLENRNPDGKQLYLIAEISEQDAVLRQETVSRGNLVTKTSDFHDSFGVTAISYNGEWTDEINWNPGKIYNLNITETSKGSNTWKYPEEDIKWSQIDSSRVRFFAYSPYSGADVFTSSDASLTYSSPDYTGAPLLTYTVAHEVKSQIDLMTATADYDTSSGGSVDFTFGHALTAVTVNAGKGIFAGKISKITLSGIYGSGTNRIGSKEWTPDESSITEFTIEKESTLNPAEGSHLTSEAVTLNDGELTFLMIPQELPDGAALKVTFTDGVSSEEHELTAELTGTWTAGTAVKYTISTTGIHVEKPHIEIIDIPDSVPTSGFIPSFKFKSFVTVYDEENGKTIQDINPLIEYSTDNGSTWSNAEWTKTAETEEGTVSAELLLKPRNVFSQLRENFHLSKSGQGSKSAPKSLVDDETANCYLIHDHGYYSFPTVYGNAIKNGAPNPSAYTYGGNPGQQASYFVLEDYVGHDDNPIAGPDIPNVDNAVLVWQDSPDLINDISLNVTKDSVLFHVNEHTINQGNAIIAVRNASNEILWSWHIWVTPYDINDNLIATTSKGYDNRTYQFTEYNLGFCDRHGEDTDDVNFKIRLKVPMPDGTNEIIEVEHPIPQITIEASLGGDNTYYQWGRKDPMLGGIWNEETLAINSNDPTEFNMRNKRYYSTEYKFTRDETQKTIGDAISNPNVFFMHDNPSGVKKTYDDYWRRHWHNGVSKGHKATIMNYWDSSLDSISETRSMDYPNGEFPTKTIYDPCPAGFCVPPPNAFSEFGKIGFHTLAENPHIKRVEKDGYYIGWDIQVSGGSIFFPITGLRDLGTNHIHPPADWIYKTTYPAHANLTFIASSCFFYSGSFPIPENDDKYKSASSTLLIYLDNRFSTNQVNVISDTNNAYGFTIRPVVDQK